MELIYVPCKDRNAAKRISVMLLKERLICCSNIIPINSIYLLKGKIKNSSEVLMIAKTSKKNSKKAEILIKKYHPYEIPAIIRIESKSNKEFDKWAQSVMD